MKQLIERIRELEAAATPGEWRYRDMDETIVDSNEQVLFPCWANRMLREVGDYADVMLVPEMRNALPRLLDRLEKLEAVAEAAKDVSLILNGPIQTLWDALAALEDK